MTTSIRRKKTNLAPDVAFEQLVADYLHDHADYFERHAQLLDELRIPHAVQGATSLIERQLQRLREANMQQRERLQRWTAAVETNERTVAKLQELSLRLFTAENLAATCLVLEHALWHDFNVEFVRLCLIGTGEAVTASVLWLAPADARLRSFAALLASGQPECGAPNRAVMQELFATQTPHVASVALLPLGRQPAFGVFVLGSTDAERFRHDVGRDHLVYLADLASIAIARHYMPPA